MLPTGEGPITDPMSLLELQDVLPMVLQRRSLCTVPPDEIKYIAKRHATEVVKARAVLKDLGVSFPPQVHMGPIPRVPVLERVPLHSLCTSHWVRQVFTWPLHSKQLAGLPAEGGA